jgi:hypothetical protein
MGSSGSMVITWRISGDQLTLIFWTVRSLKLNFFFALNYHHTNQKIELGYLIEGVR